MRRFLSGQVDPAADIAIERAEQTAVADPAGPHTTRARPVTLLFMCGLALIAAILFGTAILISDLRARALSTGERELTNITRVLAEHFDRALQSIDLVENSLFEHLSASGIASTVDYDRRLLGYDIHSMLKDKISGLPHVDVVAFVDAQGRLLNSSRSWPTPVISVADREFFKAFQSDPALGFQVSEPVLDTVTGAWTIFLVRRVSGPSGEFCGLMLGGVRLSYFEQFFGTIALNPGGTIALFRRDGTLLARHPRVDSLAGRSFDTPSLQLSQPEHSGHVAGGQTGAVDGEERIISARALQHFPIVVTASEAMQQALSEWQKEAQYLAGAAILAAVLVAVIIFLVTRQLAQSQQTLHQQTLQLDAALNNMSQGLCMFDKDARLVLRNRRYLEMYGLPAQVIRPGLSLRDILRYRKDIGILTEDPEQMNADVLSVIAHGKESVLTLEVGNGRMIQVRNRPMPGGGWVATHEDVTARRRAEQALAEAQAEIEQAEREARTAHARLRDAFEVVPEGLVLFDAEDRIVLWNQRFAELYPAVMNTIEVGTRFEDMVRAALAKGQHPDAIGREGEWLAERMARHAEAYSSHEQYGPGDRWLRVEERRTADGGSIGVRVDITELKQREASFRLLFESNPLPMYVYDIENFRFLAVNNAAIAHYGYSRQQFLCMTLFDLRPPGDDEQMSAPPPELETYYRAEALQQRKADGTAFEADIYSGSLSYGGRAARFVAVIDITDRRRAEKERDRDREFLDQIIDNVPVTIIVKNAIDRRCVLINRAGEELLGTTRAQALGKTSYDLVPKAQADIITAYDDKVAQSYVPLLIGEHADFARPDSKRIVTAKRLAIRDKDGTPRYLVSVIEDVTERKAIEQQLQQAQKMEVVGSLTGGLAHDFNNLLTIIIGNLDLLQMDFAGNGAAEQKIETILQASLRGAELTRQMLAFSRRQPLQPSCVDVNELISNTVRLLRRTLGENVTIEVRTPADIWPVLADPAQLEAALLNISINARDAMPEGGTLLIESRKVQFDSDYAAQHRDVRPGDYVALEITDTGSGMPAEVLARVFEPFFTTKAPGTGTGLGLSMVYGFIKQSGGDLDVHSEVGKGTTFTLYLPRAVAEVQSNAASAIDRPLSAVLSEVLLVVDDNVDVRATVVSQLTGLGYKILEADSAAAALAMLDSGVHIDLLFTDIVMPGPVNGKELGKMARVKRPGLKVLFTSGFPGTFGNNDSDLDVGGTLLSKPYRQTDLAKAVRDILHQA